MPVTSGCPVTAMTSRFTISRTMCGLVLDRLIESAFCKLQDTIEGVGKGCWPCASSDEMAQNKTSLPFESA